MSLDIAGFLSRAVTVVLDPLDIVLAEIAAGLHFDEFDRLLK
jgi:hypothetical protein